MRYEPKHGFASLSSFGSLVPNSKYGELSIPGPNLKGVLGLTLAPLDPRATDTLCWAWPRRRLGPPSQQFWAVTIEFTPLCTHNTFLDLASYLRYLYASAVAPGGGTFFRAPITSVFLCSVSVFPTLCDLLGSRIDFAFQLVRSCVLVICQ